MPKYRDGDLVEITGLTERMEEQGKDPRGEWGSIDFFNEEQDAYLVILSGARGWFVPEDKLKPAEGSRKK